MPLTRIARRRSSLPKSPWGTKGKMKNPLKKGVTQNPKTHEAWVVVNVSVDGLAGDINLVNCAVVCKTKKEAMETAFEKAYGLYHTYLEELEDKGLPPVTFETVWKEVDHFDSLEQEYGFDPVDNKVAYCAIRVVKAVVA